MTDPLDEFIGKKNAESPFLVLLDGESEKVKFLKSIKMVTKDSFGEEKEVLRLTCLVETEYGDKEKNFDNSTSKFAKEMKAKGAVVGSSFTLSRTGEKKDTVYTISDVVLPTATTTAQVAAAAEAVGGEVVAN